MSITFVIAEAKAISDSINTE